MISKEDKVKFFKNEIDWISTPERREYAKVLIENAPDYFFSVPASSSGKYHPPFDLGNGGLIRHTRCVAYFAKALCVAQMEDIDTTDMAIISAIAHDIQKQGDGRVSHTVTEHPILAAKYMQEMRAHVPNAFTDEQFDDMLSAVRAHMGQWGGKDGLPVPKTHFDFIVHDADYIASRKEILEFKFEPTEQVEVVEEVATPPVYNGNPKDYVLQFGKHKGKTLEEVEPTGYLDWVVKQEEFFNKEAQEMARLYLESLKSNSGKPEPAPSVVNSEIDDLPF